MKFSLAFACVLCVSRNVLGKGFYNDWINPEELSYDDLIKANASCSPRDSCVEERENDRPDIGYRYSCSCHAQCWQLGTCCIDSPHRGAPPNHECRSVGGTSALRGYYMVHKCASHTDENSVWKSLCEREWIGEDDILMLSPVTSLKTSATYKNFYCFRCHEETDKFVSWNLFLEGSNKNSEEIPEYDFRDGSETSDQADEAYAVAYDRVNETWVATVVQESISVPVHLSFEFPRGLPLRPNQCDLRVISDCPSAWTDKYVLHKCRAYTAVVYSSDGTPYKNAHCALCHGESPDTISCEESLFPDYDVGDTFSFRHLLDINKPGGDKVGEAGKCEKDELWDPYGKKCRKLKCAIPRYVINNGRCTRP